LMTTLYKTEPHFIRCVVPNTHKIPGGVEPGLVMHQYQCNGVLAGIAICRKGFPNKMLYPEFKSRYNILAAKAVAKAKNDKGAAGAVMDVIKLDKEKFRLGHTKVFFRAGILGFMEEVREDRIGAVLAWLQAGARGKASRMQFKKLQDQKLALYCCQRTIRNYYIGKTWLWWQIWLAVKPNLKCTQFGKYKAEYEEKIALAEATDAAMRGGRAAMSKLEAKVRELEVELGACQSRTSENAKLTQKSERKIKEMQFSNEEDRKNQDRMSDLASKLQAKIKTYKKQIEEAEEIAALNLAKFRKAQQELEESEERARLAEGQLSTVRASSIF